MLFRSKELQEDARRQQQENVNRWRTALQWFLGYDELFGAMFVVGLVGSIISGWWLARTRRKAVVAANPYFHPSGPVSPVTPGMSAAREPGDEGVRLERLKTLTALRDSGALTQEEFEAEKRRVLEGH